MLAELDFWVFNIYVKNSQSHENYENDNYGDLNENKKKLSAISSLDRSGMICKKLSVCVEVLAWFSLEIISV